VAIPLVDVRGQYAPLIAELRARLDEVLDSGRFILGPNVRAFEEEAAAYLGGGECVGVANGTDALVLALDALGVGPGDEVVCPSFTFYATVEAILRRDATPVFADIGADMNLDPTDVAGRVTKRTKAVVTVDLFGRPARTPDLPDGVALVEDAAQAFGGALDGRKTGTLGRVATFSFFPTKNLFALGDGGLVATGDAELAERIRLLRFHGSRDKKRFDLVGYNSRLDELQAAALRLFLPYVDEWNAGRREAAARYAELGLGEVCDLPDDEPGHVYHLYVVRTPERDRALAALREAEIGCGAYYTTPMHRQPALEASAPRAGRLAETERAAAENLALPLWPGIGASEQEQVVETVRKALAGSRSPVSA